MKTKIFAAAMLVAALVTPSLANAKCATNIPNLPAPISTATFDSISPKFRVIGYEEASGKNNLRQFFVVIQNTKTCRVNGRFMNEDQLYNDFGISDELEGGNVEGEGEGD